MPGYAAIALDNPKNTDNVGGVIRAAGNYGAALVVVGARRFDVVQPGDTNKTALQMPILRTGDVFDAIPFDCVPVAIELLPEATPLPDYTHPERAFYIFGGENHTLGKRITSRSRDVVYVPTDGCMNLAACVNVVLYDRALKRSDWPTVVNAKTETSAPGLKQDKRTP